MVNDGSGPFEVREVKESIRFGDGCIVYSTNKEKLEVVVPTMMN